VLSLSLAHRVILGVNSSRWCMYASSSMQDLRPAPQGPARSREPPGLDRARSKRAIRLRT
jgi:hypothetical protein